MRWLWIVAALVLLTSACTEKDGWPAYGRDPGNTRYSPLAQITAANVGKLKPAWTFNTGDISDGKNGMVRSGFETTPLLLDGRLYLTTPFNRVIAIDPASGKKLWAHDPQIDKKRSYGDGLINRGLAAWRNASAASCKLTLFEATLDSRLMALDGATGARCPNFGNNGEVDLRGVAGYRDGWYHMTSPPIVVDGVVIVGSAIDDNSRADMPAGVVRGYDATSGRLLWVWDPITRPAGVTVERWLTGAANAWSVFSADPARHLVYVPTGSASPDYSGGLRPGDNRWANSVVALDSRTGAFVWGYQMVHHDLWDYDTAAAPLLAHLRLNGQRTPVLIAGNKTGMLYVLDPATGKPLLPVEERAVPQSTILGESSSPTQPFPRSLPTLVRHTITPADAWGRNDADRAACRSEIERASGATIFSPPSEQGGLAIPGVFGGINWSGFAWDAKHERIIVPVSNLPFRVQLIPADKFAAGQRGAFRGDISAQRGASHAMARAPFVSPAGLPCIAPPWGELVALDIATGKIAWRKAVGDMREVFPTAEAPGSLMLGGSIVTAGGLVFTGATMDRRFYALSSATGEELWSAELPASAHAQPITYETGGKQFVVIAAGGHAKIDEEKQSDALVAFSLP